MSKLAGLLYERTLRYNNENLTLNVMIEVPRWQAKANKQIGYHRTKIEDARLIKVNDLCR